MSGAKKCVPNLRGAPHTHDRQAGARGDAAARPPHAARLKPPAQTTPAARPATNATVQPKRTPSAPPVYRPQPTPKVLQKKTPPGRPHENTRASAQRPAQTPARLAAPPVYRPEPKNVAQPKAAPGARSLPKPAAARPVAPAPPIVGARPPQTTLQMKPNPAAASTRTETPSTRPAPLASAQRPAPPTPPRPALRPSVVQRMMDDEEMEGHYGSDYWPPPDSPIKAPPTPSYNYYKYASEYHTQQGEMGFADSYMDFYEEHSGKSIGMSTGTGEDDEYDESYVDIPIGIRPSAPAALWNTVYAGLTDSQKYKGFQWIVCQENCTNRVYIDKKTKKEDGTTKRPPMCHIVAFNHIKWAVSWLYSNKSHYLVGGNYKGPDVTGFPDDTWRELVWHKSNLRPGHSKCNSQTASQAKGVPSTGTTQNAAITYVVKRLKKLKPLWF